MNLRMLAVAAWALPCLAGAAWAGESDDMTKDDYAHYLSLFSQIVLQCPLDNQTEMIDAIRALSAATGKDAPFGPKYGDRGKDLPAKIRGLLGQLQETLPVLNLEWKDGKAALRGKTRPLAAAAGIPRFALARVANRGKDPLELRLTVNALPPHPRPLAIAPGQTREALLAIRVDDAQAHEAPLAIASGGAAKAEVGIPLTVSPAAKIKGVVKDRDLGKPFPGRVYVKGADNVFRHAKAYADVPTLSQKTMIFPGNNYQLPFFYSDGTFEIDVPAGKTEITLERGFEHEIVKQTFDLKPGETREVSLESGRIISMKDHGWISGDTHVHWAKNWWNEDESLDLLRVVQRAEDVQVVNNLTLRHHNPPQAEFIAPTQRPMGLIKDYSDDTYLVQMAEEYRNAPFYGHINYLNIKELIQPISTGDLMGPNALDYPTNYSRHLEARKQGGIIIQAHGLTSESPADIVLGLNDSLDQLEPKTYYDVLDCGFRQPLTNGSDHPARLVGCARAYVKVVGPLTYKKWIQGIRDKKTFTTSGPLLFLSVNGKDIGEEVRLAKGEAMKIKARAISRRPIGRFQIVSNGKTLKEMDVAGTDQTMEFEAPAAESCWVVARCSSGKSFNAINGPGIAHTSAIYVLVDGQRIFRPGTAQAFAQNLRGGAMNLAKNGRFADDAQRKEAVAVFDRGAEAFGKLIEKK